MLFEDTQSIEELTHALHAARRFLEGDCGIGREEFRRDRDALPVAERVPAIRRFRPLPYAGKAQRIAAVAAD